MKQQKLEVKEIAVSALIPYSNNANIHTDDQIDQIAASIKEFGFRDPVGVWTNPDGQIEIVEGHGRVFAAKRLGMETVPVILLDDLTDDQRRAYTHVHNQLTRNSQFDFDILDQELEDLDFDWESFGFDDIPEIDTSDFFRESEPQPANRPASSEESGSAQHEHAPRTITCPNCGHQFTA